MIRTYYIYAFSREALFLVPCGDPEIRARHLEFRISDIRRGKTSKTGKLKSLCGDVVNDLM
jgi:hypothetical protein